MYVYMYDHNHHYTTHTHMQPPVYEEKPKPVVHFQDLPYTEWIAKRWTYHDKPFADWPTLPSTIGNVTQIAHGTVYKSSGIWVLTDTELFFARNFYSEVEFLNVSDTLGLEVVPGSMVAVGTEGLVYLATPQNITLLDCSQDYED